MASKSVALMSFRPSSEVLRSVVERLRSAVIEDAAEYGVKLFGTERRDVDPNDQFALRLSEFDITDASGSESCADLDDFLARLETQPWRAAHFRADSSYPIESDAPGDFAAPRLTVYLGGTGTVNLQYPKARRLTHILAPLIAEVNGAAMHSATDAEPASIELRDAALRRRWTKRLAGFLADKFADILVGVISGVIVLVVGWILVARHVIG